MIDRRTLESEVFEQSFFGGSKNHRDIFSLVLWAKTDSTKSVVIDGKHNFYILLTVTIVNSISTQNVDDSSYWKALSFSFYLILKIDNFESIIHAPWRKIQNLVRLAISRMIRWWLMLICLLRSKPNVIVILFCIMTVKDAKRLNQSLSRIASSSWVINSFLSLVEFLITGFMCIFWCKKLGQEYVQWYEWKSLIKISKKIKVIYFLFKGIQRRMKYNGYVTQGRFW